MPPDSSHGDTGGTGATVVVLPDRAALATHPAETVGTVAHGGGEVFVAVGTTRPEILRRLGWERFPNIWLRSDTIAYVAGEHPSFGLGFDVIAHAVNRVLRTCTVVAPNTAGRPGILFIVPARVFYTDPQRAGFVDLVVQDSDERTGERYLRATHVAGRRTVYRGSVLWRQ